ncbi:DUF2520 domain-containing protein [Acinetobacter sp. B5B]|uniref:Rossmann-like and DUF2520 domain-containing protein n=1 Tax=Acinetobacter baretiae TaxID=2605383 RepID=UPI0018C308C8|nr:Rossmann-like and DUF2520 domain-containing protein [Acinetobacter baretiae]MBF7682103.1 DUF2520 domain-containing protein [Acinetobacter baretiae]
MRISIIGSGRVATHLTLALKAHGHVFVDVCSRKITHAEGLAARLNARALNHIDNMDLNIDVVIIAVSDQSIGEVVQQLVNIKPTCLVLHTSGSTHVTVISDHLAYAGVFYPLQTFSVEHDVDWLNVPVLIEANTPQQLEIVRLLAQQLSTKVYEYSSAQRLSLHLAAVFACNFSNYCYDVAHQIVQEQGVDFELLFPLMMATTNKATSISPLMAQTGPAMRHDEVILNQHQALLKKYMPNHLEMYRLLSEQIQKRHS